MLIEGRALVIAGGIVFAAPFSGAVATAASDGWVLESTKVAACFEEMDRDPALAVVNAKFARREPSAAQLADPSFVNETEAAALRLRVEKTKPCRALRLAAVHAHHPLLKPAYTTLYYQADQVFLYLRDGYVTYGEANRLAFEALTAFKAREEAYFAAKSDGARRTLSTEWSETLQRAHSNPPPSNGPVKCEWEELNLSCR